ncbi:MAG: EAL domain-containing protein [Pseudomonadota bacterium]|nr:EAL domain-containing protein [Pseudomonadota bacterium]
MSAPSRRENTHKFLPPALTALGAFAIAAFCYATGLLGPFDRAFVEDSTRLFSNVISSDVVIVEIDARSLHELGSWPWPRSRHAALIDTLQRLGARRMFFDVDFSSSSTSSEDDLLAQALARAQGLVVLPAFWQPLSADSKPLLLSEPLPQFRHYASMASVNLVPDRDGLVREVPNMDAIGTTSAPPVWRRLTGAPARSVLTVDYRVAPTSFQKYSYCDLVQGAIAPDLHGKTILVGATAIELGDIVPVPVYRSLPGVVLQAIAYESGRRAPLRPLQADALLAALALCAVLCVYTMGKGSWRRLPWVMGAWIAVVLLASFLLYGLGNQIPGPSPFIAVVLCSFVGVALSMLYTETWQSWRASRKLRHQDALLRQIVDESVDALLTLDPSGVIRTANSTAGRLLEREPATLSGMPLHALAPQLCEVLNHLTPQRALLRECVEFKHVDGRETPVEVSARHLAWEDSSVIAVTIHDVSAQRRREEELRYRAMHDNLTGLPNRLKLAELLAAELDRVSDDKPLMLLMLDLDGFKEVNDTLGHDMGDALLVELGKRFIELTAHCACVARLGGDEFAILLTAQPPAGIASFHAQVFATVSAPILIRGIPISLGASIGIATAPMHGRDPSLLLQRADLALYAAKRNHTPVQVFDPSMDTRSPRRLQMLTLLRSAIQQDELHLVFQPKVPLQKQGTAEVEVLCRWNSATLGPVSPAEFIPLAEASDVIRPLTEWILTRALTYCRSWHARGLPLKVAVNLSARHLQDEQLPDWLGTLLSRSGIRAQFLELEITEGAIMRDPDRAMRILQAIKTLGITLSIDDYGTGYSSLSYLQKLAVDRLKIDKSFVAGLLCNDRDQLIVKSTIDLAHGLELEVIAEGIETPQQLAVLQTLGCDYAQGYLLSCPLTPKHVFDWFSARTESNRIKAAAD